jgi:hypothetical protein
VEASPIHNRYHYFYRQFIGQTPQPARNSAVCYDGGVRQRQAIRVGRKFFQHVIPAVVKPAHALWNEVIGFIFLCLGASFGFYAVRYALRRDTMRLVFAGAATVIMVWYGVDAFRRARKISRS